MKDKENENRYLLLHRIGVALSGERDRDRLLDLILSEAQALCHADGGTLYLKNEQDELEFAIVKNSSLGINLGGVSDQPVTFPPLPLFSPDGEALRNNVATYAAHKKELVHIPDAYDSESFDFSGTQAFDQRSGYRSQSFLTIPLVNSEGRVIGVLQLLNAQDPVSKQRVPFATEHQETVAALASQAAVALDNKLLIEAQRELLESFIKMLAAAIDAKSPYTGAHCERVPKIVEMLMREVCSTTSGPFAQYEMNREEAYELHIAAWLHDCGKVTTPTHVMDKGTKLETIHDRIQDVRTRFEVLRRDAKISYLEAVAAGEEKKLAYQRYENELARLDKDLFFLERANVGGEYLPPEAQDRLREIGREVYEINGTATPLLSEEELENLCVSRGTLTEDERLIINGHMVQTARMLDALPFPRHLRRVPEYATGHHEKMDGRGYPRGIFAGDMSIPARAMAIADVFEALTADDRPYKKAKKLSESMRIMGFMKRDNHLDPEIFDLFISSGVYRKFAEQYLDSSLIDEVDEETLLAIKPVDFELPDRELRAERKTKFLDDYEARFPLRTDSSSPLSRVPLSMSPGAMAPPSTSPED